MAKILVNAHQSPKCAYLTKNRARPVLRSCGSVEFVRWCIMGVVIKPRTTGRRRAGSSGNESQLSLFLVFFLCLLPVMPELGDLLQFWSIINNKFRRKHVQKLSAYARILRRVAVKTVKCKQSLLLQLNVNWLVPKSVTSNDPERHNDRRLGWVIDALANFFRPF